MINDDMRFGSSNPAFVQGCRGSLALMIANPVWIPGSLTNPELEKEIRFWRNVTWCLGKLGFTSAGVYITVKGQSVLKQVGQNLGEITPGKAVGFSSVTKPLLSALKPDSMSAPLAFGIGAATVAESSLTDLEAEAKRRGQLGSMTRLETERFGPSS